MLKETAIKKLIQSGAIFPSDFENPNDYSRLSGTENV
jgi:hypothetical protein